MKQGEIWYSNLSPTKGSEQSGFRPVLIISGNMLNTYLPIVICCPLTSKIKEYKGNVILQPSSNNGLEKISEVLTFHVRSVSKERLVKKIGVVSENEIQQVKDCLNDILTL
ncbi:MAG: type II toxin-antitoxin system PemK/MazF family toxin [Salibacteraceae bacterium]